MNLRRVRAVARKEFLHVVRDFRSLLMAIATPVMLLTLFGYALTLDVDNVPMAVWDQSGTERSRELVSRFAGSRYFALREHVDNYRELERAIDTGRVMMGLVVPRDFAQKIEAGRDVAVQLIVDGTDSNTATIAIGYAEVVAQISEYTTATGRCIDSVLYPSALDDYFEKSKDSRLRRFNSEMKKLYQAVSSCPLEDLIEVYQGTKYVRNLWGAPYHYLCFSKLPSFALMK